MNMYILILQEIYKLYYFYEKKIKTTQVVNNCII